MILFLPVLLLAACSNPDAADSSAPSSGSPSGEKPRTVAVAPDAREATVGVAGRARKMKDPSGAALVARTKASGGSSYYEADTVLGIRYGAHERYERVVLDLGSGGEPAETVPKWTLMSPTGDGLLRVTLQSMSRTAVGDGGFGDALLESFYVVRAPEGGMFVDILARTPFAYRVLEPSNPARLVVDFKPAGSPLKARRR